MQVSISLLHAFSQCLLSNYIRVLVIQLLSQLQTHGCILPCDDEVEGRQTHVSFAPPAPWEGLPIEGARGTPHNRHEARRDSRWPTCQDHAPAPAGSRFFQHQLVLVFLLFFRMPRTDVIALLQKQQRQPMSP